MTPKSRKNIQQNEQTAALHASLGSITADHIPDALITTDMQFNVTGWNAAAEKVYGWASTETMGKSLPSLLQTEYQKTTRDAAMAESLQTSFWSGEVTQVRKDGTRFPVSSYVSVIHDDDGQPIGYVGINRDMTEIKQARDEVHQIGQRYQTLIDHAPDGVVLVGADGRFKYASPSALRIFGYLQNEVPASHPNELTHPDDLERVLAALGELFQHPEQVITIQYRFKHKTGEWRWIESTFSNLLALPSVEAIVINFRDIHERKMAEEQQKITLAKYEALFASFPLGITVSDEDGQVLESNPTAEKLLHLSEAEHIQRQIDGSEWQIIRPDGSPMPPEEFASVRALAEKRVVENVEMGIVSDNVTTWLSVNAAPISIPGYGVVITYGDITERKQAEAARKESDERFRLMFEHNDSVMMLVEPESGAIVDANPAAASFYGYSIEQLRQMKVQDINTLPPEEVAERRRQAVEKQSSFFVFQHRLANGEIRAVELHASPIHDQGRTLLFSIIHDVTERKRIEAEIKDIMFSLESAEEQVGLASWSFDALTGKRWWSPQMYRGLECDPANGIPTMEAYLDMIHVDDRDMLAKTMLQLMNGELPERREYRVRSCQGWRILSPNYRVEKDEKGRVVRFFGTSLDVTEQRMSERALRESEQNLQNFLNNSPDTIYVLDLVNHSSHFLNREEFLGYSKAELESSNSIMAAVHPDDLAELQSQWGNTMKLKDDQAAMIQYRLKTRQGKYEWIQQRNTVLSRADHGMPQKLLVTLSVITEQKHAETALQQSEKKYRSLHESMIDGFTRVSMDGRFIEFNEVFRQMLGYSESELLQATYMQVTPEKWHQYETQILNEQILKRGFSDVYEKEYRRKDGSIFPVELHTVLLYDEQGQPESMWAIARDITLRKSEEMFSKARLRLATLSQEQQSIDVLLQSMLDEAESLTASSIGFFHFVYDDQNTISLQTWSTNTLQTMCTAEGKGQHYPVITAGIWADCIRQGKASIHNDYSAAPHRTVLPQGHAPVTRLISIPVKRNGRIVAALGVGNKPSDYNERDVDLVTRLADAIFDAVIRKRAETALRASEEKYRGLLGSLDNVIATVDLEGRFLYMNGPAAEQLDHPAEELIGKTMYELFPESVAAQQMASIRAVAAENQGHVFESISVIHGQPHWYRTFIQPLHDDAGQVTSVLINSTDIHELKTMQQELLELNRSLEERVKERTAEIQDLYDNAPVGYHSLDMNGNFVTINETELNWLGYSRKELLGKPFTSVISRQDESIFVEKFELFKTSGNALEIEFDAVRKDGSTFPILINSTAIYDRNGQYISSRSTMSDITKRKHAENALRLANSELERAMRVKDEFLANMSHELRTPLNAIIGLSDSLTEFIAGELNDKQQKYVNIIHESGQHLLTLINDILDISKIEAGQVDLVPSLVNIQTVCESSLRMVKQLAQKKQLDVHLEIDDHLDSLEADERRLKQMLVNLLSNAVKFTPEKGQVGLEVRGDWENQKIRFTVWDNGIGIKLEDQARLFRPFMQVNQSLTNTSGGTGLGLALVAQLAQLHKGSVEMESQYGTGSRFTIILPWHNTRNQEFNAREDMGIEPAHEDEQGKLGQTILLVEDTETVVMVVRDYLKYVGYKVEVARNGLEGIELAKRLKPDLILMDIQMPEMDGLQATRILREQDEFKTTPIIALTAFAMSGDRERFLEAGVNDHISKPVNLKNLVTTIQMYCGRRNENVP